MGFQLVVGVTSIDVQHETVGVWNLLKYIRESSGNEVFFVPGGGGGGGVGEGGLTSAESVTVWLDSITVGLDSSPPIVEPLIPSFERKNPAVNE